MRSSEQPPLVVAGAPDQDEPLRPYHADHRLIGSVSGSVPLTEREIEWIRAWCGLPSSEESRGGEVGLESGPITQIAPLALRDTGHGLVLTVSPVVPLTPTAVAELRQWVGLPDPPDTRARPDR